MYKIVRAREVVLDDRKYKLNIKTATQEDTSEKVEKETTKPKADLQLEREEMLEAVKSEAEALRKQVMDDREEILQDAYEKSQEMMENAREQGRQEGFQAGYDEGKAAAQVLIEEAIDIKEKTMALQDEFFEKIEQEIIELVLGISEKVLHHELEHSKDFLLNLVHEGIESISYREELILRVAPADEEQAWEILPKVYALSEHVDELEVKVDAALKPGSCLLETKAGTIDISVGSQFEALKKKFEQALNERD